MRRIVDCVGAKRSWLRVSFATPHQNSTLRFVSFRFSWELTISTQAIVDFTGCAHYRHPFEMGGLGYSLNIVWAQVFPFVALQLFDGDETVKDTLTVFLAASFTLWLLFNVAFFCTIDLEYLNTFFGTKTAQQYTCELYLTSEADFQRFKAVFGSRISYTKKIHGEVTEWVAANIEQWIGDKPDWFKLKLKRSPMFFCRGTPSRQRGGLGEGETVLARRSSQTSQLATTKRRYGTAKRRDGLIATLLEQDGNRGRLGRDWPRKPTS